MNATERLVAAWWGPRVEQSVADLTAQELDELLDALELEASDRPFLVDVIDEAGCVLTIGLGRPVTVLLFMEGSLEPPYLTSFVDAAESVETIWFDYAESESEFGPEQVVDGAVGRSVVRSFAATGDRSGVTWSEV